MNALSIPLNGSPVKIEDDVRIQESKRQKIKTSEIFRNNYKNTMIHHHFYWKKGTG